MTSIFISNPFRHANSANVERLTPIHHGTSGYRLLPCSTYLPCHSIWRGIWSQIEPDAVPSFHYVKTDNYYEPLLGMIKPTAIVFHYRFARIKNSRESIHPTVKASFTANSNHHSAVIYHFRVIPQPGSDECHISLLAQAMTRQLYIAVGLYLSHWRRIVGVG